MKLSENLRTDDILPLHSGENLNQAMYRITEIILELKLTFSIFSCSELCNIIAVEVRCYNRHNMKSKINVSCRGSRLYLLRLKLQRLPTFMVKSIRLSKQAKGEERIFHKMKNLLVSKPG